MLEAGMRCDTNARQRAVIQEFSVPSAAVGASVSELALFLL